MERAAGAITVVVPEREQVAGSFVAPERLLIMVENRKEIEPVLAPEEGENVVHVVSVAVELRQWPEDVVLFIRLVSSVAVHGEEWADGETFVRHLAQRPKNREGWISIVDQGPEVDTVLGIALSRSVFVEKRRVFKRPRRDAACCHDQQQPKAGC